MRRDLLVAGALAALVLGGLALAVRVTTVPERGTADAVAVRELELRDRPDPSITPHAFIAPGSPVRIESTGAPGWVYVYQELGTGVLLEGYVPASAVGPPRNQRAETRLSPRSSLASLARPAHGDAR